MCLSDRTLPPQVIVSFAVTEECSQPSADVLVRRSMLCEIVRALLERYLACDELAIPLLPDVAVRVVHNGKNKSGNAQLLADIIQADPALTMYVLRIAASAVKRPALPITSLQHAVAWLGLDEVANIAFTLALQGKMLDVKGQQRKARRLVAPFIGKRTVVAPARAHARPGNRSLLPVRAAAQHRQGGHIGRRARGRATRRSNLERP